jgi:sporulation protein YlmC with PRC-barrel domain
MRKLLLPAITLCVSTSLFVSGARADDKVVQERTTTTVKTESTLDFKDHMNASQLLHSKVLDRSGQKIGELEDIVLDPNTGRIQFGVIKLSGDLADNGKYTPVPFSLLKISDTSAKADVFGHRDLVLQTDRDKLLSATRQFSIKNWPDRERVVVWGPDVYTHYGVTLDSNVARGSSSTAIQSDVGTGSSTITVREREPVYRYRYEYTYSERDTHKPIDNGTGPDGKDTFRFTPRPWPYSEMSEFQNQ